MNSPMLDRPLELEQRIAAALKPMPQPSADQVDRLVFEVERELENADIAVKRARSRALDPTICGAPVADARREMEDAAFRLQRLEAALPRLTRLLANSRLQEGERRRRLEHEQFKAERTQLTEKLQALEGRATKKSRG